MKRSKPKDGKQPKGTPTVRAAALSPNQRPDEIRQRAQELFKARGGTPGHELDDWLRAEQQLKEERATTDTTQPFSK
jgi:hypothetical protein